MIIRISNDEVKNYVLLDRSHPDYIHYAVAFTLTQRENGWDYINYYSNSVLPFKRKKR